MVESPTRTICCWAGRCWPHFSRSCSIGSRLQVYGSKPNRSPSSAMFTSAFWCLLIEFQGCIRPISFQRPRRPLSCAGMHALRVQTEEASLGWGTPRSISPLSRSERWQIEEAHLQLETEEASLGGGTPRSISPPVSPLSRSERWQIEEEQRNTRQPPP